MPACRANELAQKNGCRLFVKFGRTQLSRSCMQSKRSKKRGTNTIQVENWRFKIDASFENMVPSQNIPNSGSKLVSIQRARPQAHDASPVIYAETSLCICTPTS